MLSGRFGNEKRWIFVSLVIVILIMLYGIRQMTYFSMTTTHLSEDDIKRIIESSLAKVTSKSANVPLHDVHRMVNEAIDQAISSFDRKQKSIEMANAGKRYPFVKDRNDLTQKRILVTGGAGFVGSHLVDKLMMEGHMVYVIDNLFTGKRRNIQHWLGHPNFEFTVHDVVNPFLREVDEIYHLACPASPPHYQYNPIKTIKTSTSGTLNMLGLAKRVNARILLASTSEVYGDPEVHPQKESYWGNVNPIGPRSCYDEGKRVAETMMYAYHTQSNVDIRIARIFNTFGPRMNLRDGRVISNFILEAIQNKSITLYGDGTQTRSFQYVDDLVDGLIALMHSNTSLPVNLGNPEEYKIVEMAKAIVDLTQSSSDFIFLPSPIDDPQRRRPDISRAKELLNWRPKYAVMDGIKKTIKYFEDELQGIDVAPMKPPL